MAFGKMSSSVSHLKTRKGFALQNALRRPELFLALSLCLVLASCVTLSVFRAQAIAWSGFAFGLLPAAGLFLVGLYLRLYKNNPRLAQLAVANSLFLGFMGLTTLLIYLRFPIAELSFDKWLIQLDSTVGYTWPNMLAKVAAYPELGYALRYVYHSSLPQLFVMIGFLALTGRAVQLDRALLAGSLSLLMTTLLWWIAPSIGPSVFYDIPKDLQNSIGLVTNDTYADILRRLADDGLAIIGPSDIVGTIAFPSYHTVMALLVVWYLRGTRLFFPALVLNIAMIPAILSHGGHHLTDMAGGLAVFALGAWIAARPWFGRPAA